MKNNTDIFGWNIEQGDYDSTAEADKANTLGARRAKFWKRGAAAIISAGLFLGLLFVFG